MFEQSPRNPLGDVYHENTKWKQQVPQVVLDAELRALSVAHHHRVDVVGVQSSENPSHMGNP